MPEPGVGSKPTDGFLIKGMILCYYNTQRIRGYSAMSKVQSMTAYARGAEQGRFGQLSWEVRAVNHRYLELNMNLPSELRELEQDFRQLIRSQVHRGKVDCTLRYQPLAGHARGLSFNEQLVQQLAMVGQQVDEVLPNCDPWRMVDILRWPGVVDVQEVALDEVKAPCLSLLTSVLEQFIAARQREGKAMQDCIEQRMQSIASEIQQIEPLVAQVLKDYRQRMDERLAELKLEIDEHRFEQEMVIVAQKLDISEEIDRLKTHLAEVSKTLSDDDSIGRRLDFMMQELNREANTLASKANHSDVTKHAVSIKVFIEQMREQIQNIQ